MINGKGVLCYILFAPSVNHGLCQYDRDDDYNGFYGCGCVYKTYSPRSWQQYVPWLWMRVDRWPTALHLCTCNGIWFMGYINKIMTGCGCAWTDDQLLCICVPEMQYGSWVILTKSWLVVDARGPMTSCSASVSAPSVNHAPFVGFLAPAENVVCWSHPLFVLGHPRCPLAVRPCSPLSHFV